MDRVEPQATCVDPLGKEKWINLAREVVIVSVNSCVVSTNIVEYAFCILGVPESCLFSVVLRSPDACRLLISGVSLHGDELLGHRIFSSYPWSFGIQCFPRQMHDRILHDRLLLWYMAVGRRY